MDLSKLTDEQLNQLARQNMPAQNLDQNQTQRDWRSFPTYSEPYKKGLDAEYKNKQLEDLINNEAKTTQLPPKEREDINTLRNILNVLPKFAEKKNSGFGGEGIDTGPLVGGKLNTPNWVPIPDFNFVPSGLSAWLNKGNLGFSDKGSAASDRTTFRQIEKELFNPIKKDISGTAVSDQERLVDLVPMLPTEQADDQAFFNQTFESGASAIEKLKTILDTAKKSNVDVSQFKDLENLDPEKFKQDLMRSLSQNPNGSFSKEFPEESKSYLGKMLQGQQSKQQDGNFRIMLNKRDGKKYKIDKNNVNLGEYIDGQ